MHDDATREALAPRAAEYLLRIKGDLRLGLPVALKDAGTVALVAWVETLTDARLAALSALGHPQLVVTAHRAAALGLPETGAGETVTLDVPQAAGLAWLTAIAGQAAVTAEEPAVPAPQTVPVTAAGSVLHRAAIALAKAEQMLPAALVVPLGEDAELVRRLDLTVMSAADVIAALERDQPQHPISSARLPMDVSEAGHVHVFRSGNGGEEHYAIEIGAPDLTGPVTVRLHSSCFTGDVLGSRKCDCGAQLRGAMSAMAETGGGVLLYLNQEGRGIGLANKMRAYTLQDAGLDTVEANQWLGFEDDERDFRIGANMLHRLGIAQVRLMTNNPAKIAILAAQGIEVIERVPLHQGRTGWNDRYIATKIAKSGHLPR
nr:GTP cyclohydrolase II [Roseivivax lentus]